MRQRVKSAWGAGLVVGGTLLVGILLYSGTGNGLVVPISGVPSKQIIDKEVLANQLGAAIRSNNFPEKFALEIEGATKQARVQYTLNEAAQAEMQKLMGQYKPDYGAFVAMDARTGRILSMVSYSSRLGNENLTLRASFPSASIFKVVTASAAIDLNKASPNTVVPFNGALHTLYKKNVESTKETRWTRHMTLREAFARSVNVFLANWAYSMLDLAILKGTLSAFFSINQFAPMCLCRRGTPKSAVTIPGVLLRQPPGTLVKTL